MRGVAVGPSRDTDTTLTSIQTENDIYQQMKPKVPNKKLPSQQNQKVRTPAGYGYDTMHRFQNDHLNWVRAEDWRLRTLRSAFATVEPG